MAELPPVCMGNTEREGLFSVCGVVKLQLITSDTGGGFCDRVVPVAVLYL